MYFHNDDISLIGQGESFYKPLCLHNVFVTIFDPITTFEVERSIWFFGHRSVWITIFDLVEETKQREYFVLCYL